MKGHFAVRKRLRHRLAGSAAASVVAALVLACASPVTVPSGQSPTAVPTAPPAATATIEPSSTPNQASPGGPASPAPAASAGPSATPAPTPTVQRSFATRVRLPLLGIDMPVVSGDLEVPGNLNDYPLCDVAMYLPEFVQPGEAGTTYIYAHAQRGMFLPLLRASEIDDGAALIGGLVEVFTSADELHVYEIVVVKRHATDFSLATNAGDAEQLILQTSEGPTGTVPKLQVAARPVSVSRATPSEAQPAAQPRVCLPGG